MYVCTRLESACDVRRHAEEVADHKTDGEPDAAAPMQIEDLEAAHFCWRVAGELVLLDKLVRRLAHGVDAHHLSRGRRTERWAMRGARAQ